jgi:hypothetical protein
VANWAPREENLPQFEERPMSSTKWRAAVNEIYEKINYLKNLHDELGNPISNPSPGNLWFDLNNNVLKVWTGVSWNEFLIKDVNTSESGTPLFVPLGNSLGKLDGSWLTDATTLVKGIIRLATNVEAVAGSLATVAISPAALTHYMSQFSFGDASTTQKGVIRIATSEEAEEGTLNTVAMTPYRTRVVVDAAINEAGFPTPASGFPGEAVTVNDTATAYVLKDVVSESSNLAFVYALIFGG